MAIKVFNTLTRKKEELIPRDDGKVGVYVCGPTVYNYIHIGNARAFLNFEMIRRYLEFSGYEVTFVLNITDVDDKIINRAVEEGVPPSEVAGKYLDAFERDMESLGIRPPDIAPRATDHVPDMVEVIEGLIERGHAYVSDGDVYFDVSSFTEYGKLSGRNLEEQRASERCGAEAGRKRDPLDFVLWKASKPGEPSWESPWGPGRPGWHIECSTMSIKYLGEGFDIHGGGLDLVFPHHENEIAQAEAYSGEPFVRCWIHSGMLNIDREKMSKSLGNIKLLREVLEEHEPDTVRMLMLGTHYRSPLSFSDEALADAKASLERVRNCAFNVSDTIDRATTGGVAGEREKEMASHLSDALRQFREAMDDDFNSAAALGVVFGVVREANTYISEAGASATVSVLLEAKEALESMCGALGIMQGPTGEAPAGRAPERGPSREDLVDLLLAVREAAREGKNFELADMIRSRLTDLGVKVEDVRGGHRWRFEP